MISQQRLRRLAKALCMAVGDKPLALVRDAPLSWGCWWLVGCIGGDVILPHTKGAKTSQEALMRTESWLAHRLAALDAKEEEDFYNA